jgi:hypothetical protein
VHVQAHLTGLFVHDLLLKPRQYGMPSMMSRAPSTVRIVLLLTPEMGVDERAAVAGEDHAAQRELTIRLGNAVPGVWAANPAQARRVRWLPGHAARASA